MAEIGQRMLADLPVHLAQAAALVLPAARMPFPWFLLTYTACSPLIVADPDEKNLTWQQDRLGQRAIYVSARAQDLPPGIRGVGLALNPFGLQHDLAHAPFYASTIREHCQLQGALITLDWGENHYPDALAALPGIAEDIHYSRDRLLDPYTQETGWKLQQAWELPFTLPHTTQALVQKLTSEEAAVVHSTFTGDILIGASVIYRRYQAI
jgi:hypothetical protein